MDQSSSHPNPPIRPMTSQRQVLWAYSRLAVLPAPDLLTVAAPAMVPLPALAEADQE